MSAADASSLNSASWWYAIGAWFVVIGVLMEGAEILARRYAKGKQRKFIGPLQHPLTDPATPGWAHNIGDIGFAVLVLALTLEQVCHQRIEEITGRERDRLTNELKNTTELAGNAIRESREANARAEDSRLKAALVESNNLELKIKLQPREITFNQVTNFIFLTEHLPKIPVRVRVLQSADLETVNYAYQFRQMLSQAGFGIPPDSDAWGITRIDAGLAKSIGGNQQWPTMFFLTSGTNNARTVWQVSVKSNGFDVPIPYSTNVEQIYDAMQSSLNQIDIKTDWMPATWMKEGEYEFLVPQKLR